MIVLLSTFLLLGCCCAPVLSQLGEIKPSVATVQTSSSSSTPDYYDEVIFDDYDNPDIVLNRDAGLRRTWSWSVAGTYQGCLNNKYITNGTYIYFNLTEDSKDVFGVNDKAEACFYLCNNKDPFSLFISVNNGLRKRHLFNNDACGCHADHEIDIYNVIWDDDICDVDDTFVRIYCGPANAGCINAASHLRNPSSIFYLILSFLVVCYQHL